MLMSLLDLVFSKDIEPFVVTLNVCGPYSVSTTFNLALLAVLALSIRSPLDTIAS